MALTAAQLPILRAHIDASPDLLVFPNNADGHVAIAQAVNLPATPNFTVWKTDISRNDVGKAFVASTLSAITAGNNDKLNNFAAWNETVNPSRADQRQFFEDVFSVSAGAPTRAALQVLWRRLATRAEQLYATGTGSDASPATLTVEGDITPRDVEEARR